MNTCNDYSLVRPVDKLHKHVYTPVFTSYSNMFRLFDNSESCKLIWKKGDQDVKFAFMFHRLGLGLKFEVTEDLNTEDYDIFVDDSDEQIKDIPKNYVTRKYHKDLTRFIVQYTHLTDKIYSNMIISDMLGEKEYISRYTFVPAIASVYDTSLPDTYVSYELNDDYVELSQFDQRLLLPQYEYESNLKIIQGRQTRSSLIQQLKKIRYSPSYIKVNSKFKPSQAFFKILEIFNRENIPNPNNILFLAEAPGMFIIALTELYRNNFDWKANTYMGDGLLEDTYGVIENTKDKWIFGDVASEDVYQRCTTQSYDIVTSDLGIDIDENKDEVLSKFFYAVVKIAIGCNAKHVIVKVFLPLSSELSLLSIRMLRSKYSSVKYIKTSLNLHSDEVYIYASNSKSSTDRSSHSDIVNQLCKIHINALQNRLKSIYLRIENLHEDQVKTDEFLKVIKWN
jgi:hypothetical protein